MAKILMVNVPYAGHTNPTLPLAKELVQRGHSVSYINAPEWKDKILATGAGFIPYKDYPANPTEQQKKTRCFEAAYKTAMSVGGEYDILLYEMFFYPGKKVAERLGIPCVRQFSQPAWNPQAYALFRKSSKLFLPSCKIIDLQVMNRRTQQALGMKRGLVQRVVHDEVPLNIVYLGEQFQPCRDTFGDSYLFVGPPAIEPCTRDAKIDYAKLARPLVYISMGSIMSSQIFCKRCIKAFGGKPVSVILTTGRIPPESLGPLPENIHAYSFAPQLEILQHADLFVTHGGMNSVNEAVASGIPMLVLPVMNDQPINAGMVVQAGNGRRMRAFPTTARTLYRNTIEALGDMRLADAARRLQQAAIQAPGVTAAARAVEKLL